MRMLEETIQNAKENKLLHSKLANGELKCANKLEEAITKRLLQRTQTNFDLLPVE